jgi:putative chitinase
MSLITADILIRSGALPSGAALYADPLAAACDKRGIISRPAVIAFLANVMNESAAMTRVVEDTYYSDAAYLYSVFRSHFASQSDAANYTRNPAALAAKVYGNMQGRGLMQTTGLVNYTAYAAACGKPLAEVGAYMETPEGAADSAAWVFVHNGCLPFAERGDLLNVTRRIEGGQNPIGWVSVQKWNAQITRAFGGASVALPPAHPVATSLHAGSSTVAKPASTAARPVQPQSEADALMDAELIQITGA